jgi:hypothetical protein
MKSIIASVIGAADVPKHFDVHVFLKIRELLLLKLLKFLHPLFIFLLFLKALFDFLLCDGFLSVDLLG